MLISKILQSPLTLFRITASGSGSQVLPAQVKHLTWKCVSCTRTTSPLQTSRHLWQRIGPQVLSPPPEPWWADEADGWKKNIQLVFCWMQTGLVSCKVSILDAVLVHRAEKNMVEAVDYGLWYWLEDQGWLEWEFWICLINRIQGGYWSEPINKMTSWAF